jgi:cytochrome c oxidase subunit 1
MMGGTIVAFIGGIHHWWPKMTGKMYSETWGKIACLLIFIGFNVTFFTQFLLGSQGMPRRYYTYIPQFEQLHYISTIGSQILGIGLFVTLFCLLHSLAAGKKAPKNPWRALSLEWEAESPPIEHNFHGQPICKHGPYDYGTETKA